MGHSLPSWLSPLLQDHLHHTTQLQLMVRPQHMLMGLQYMDSNTLSPMTTARLTSEPTKLVMVTRQLAHIVLPFLMVAPKLSPTASTMPILVILLMLHTKEYQPTLQQP